jgi:hypothetical protein
MAAVAGYRDGSRDRGEKRIILFRDESCQEC